MANERGIIFEKIPPDQRRFFSGGHLNAFRKHLGKDGIVDFGKLWVRAMGDHKTSFRLSVEYVFFRGKMAKRDGEEFSEKIVITGTAPENRIKTTGGMNDEAEYIEGPVPIDGVFLIEGDYNNPKITDITSQILQSKQ